MRELTIYQREKYFQNLKTFMMEEYSLNEEDMDDEDNEELINRETQKLFKQIFEEEYYKT